MVISPVDQFQRNDFALHQFAQLLMPADVAADAIAGEERLAAEQRVARPFQARLGFQRADLETVLREPLPVVGFFLLPLRDGETGPAPPRCGRSARRWP